jgi:predicted membrane-bound spermidine synthase
MSLAWYFAFFLISGFCSLVYEVVWLRLSMARFGVTTPMVSIVLSVFMAGLALGSVAGAAVARRAERQSANAPLRLYGGMELLIGAAGLLVPHLLRLGYELTTRSGGVHWNSASYYLISGACVAVSLLPWCTAMGATFPLAMAAIRGTVSSTLTERSFSYLYVANVLGAVLGTLIPAFILIELWGFQATLYLASALNLLLAGTVGALSFSRAATATSPRSRSAEPTKASRDLSGFVAGDALCLLFLTGFCTMALEVVWIRLFTVYLGNVVYAFAIILATYLGATWAGSAVYRSWVAGNDAPDGARAWAFVGLLALLPLASADPALPVGDRFHSAMIRAALGIGPLSAALGFLTPLLVDHFSGGSPDRAGRAYAVNIVGGILGPVVSGFWVLPMLGNRWGLVVLSLPLFAIGLFGAARKKSADEVTPALAGSGFAWIASALLALPLAVYSTDYESFYTNRVVLRDYMATVLAGTRDGHKRLLINGVGMTSLSSLTKYMAHLPLAHLERPPRDGLVICFGMGTTFRSMLSWGIDATVVELNPSVPKLFDYFHPDAPAWVRSPRAHIVVDDGRRFLERSRGQYDVITLDPPPPISTPTTSLLYSREFYAAAKKHLRPGGILQAWLPIKDPGWDLTTQTAFAKALRDAFPYVRVFSSARGWGFHMLASESPIPSRTAEELAHRMPAAAAADLIEWRPTQTPASMYSAVLKTEQPIDRITSIRPATPAIQDDRPINEYFFLRRLLE